MVGNTVELPTGTGRLGGAGAHGKALGVAAG